MTLDYHRPRFLLVWWVPGWTNFSDETRSEAPMWHSLPCRDDDDAEREIEALCWDAAKGRARAERWGHACGQYDLRPPSRGRLYDLDAGTARGLNLPGRIAREVQGAREELEHEEAQRKSRQIEEARRELERLRRLVETEG